MTWHHRMSFGTIAIAVCLSLPTGAWAQSSDTRTDGRRKSGTYLQTGIAHGQADIFKRSSLTHWDVELFGTNYDLVSAKLEFETYFGGTLLQLSGFSLGYRKDGLRHAESGHMFSGGVFRDFDLKVAAVKLAGGVEWGLSSHNFDQTKFASLADGTLRYRHSYIHRNADVPFLGTSSDGTVYPFIELSIVQRPSFLLFEVGMRLNITRFNVDDFEISPTGQLLQAPGRTRVLVPYLFADFGIRLF
ncbi:MAG: hypothetical protein O3B65_02615 [Chloroflexi bacterium]|nr:hypothetical protein [Chloroflexota bacterium]